MSLGVALVSFVIGWLCSCSEYIFVLVGARDPVSQKNEKAGDELYFFLGVKDLLTITAINHSVKSLLIIRHTHTVFEAFFGIFSFIFYFSSRILQSLEP